MAAHRRSVGRPKVGPGSQPPKTDRKVRGRNTRCACGSQGPRADRLVRQHTSADLGTIIAAVERRTAQTPLSKAPAHTGLVGYCLATPGAPDPSI